MCIYRYHIYQCCCQKVIVKTESLIDYLKLNLHKKIKTKTKIVKNFSI